MLSHPLPRRRFLRTIVVGAGAITLRPLAGCGSSTDPSGVFPLSVASGDPRADSIVLWTRVAATGDATLRLEVATDEAFTSLVTLTTSELVASSAHDHCVRVKVTGLVAGTRYYYRFEHAGTFSRTGRFKTAAAPSSAVPVRFAIVSCQDFVGRWYNSLLKLLETENDDLDFVVHLGDYIYETTGDPSFMMASDERRVTFTETSSAIALEEDGQTFWAARSLDNYRELYRTYRSDPVLQQVHERFPFIVTWDDHEFSNDCWQDVATYTAGRQDERDTLRRAASEQAFLEYQPIARDHETEGALDGESREQLFPANRIYRDFRFGLHVHLVMTDTRSYRPDHPIPETAWPGVVVMNETQVRTMWEQRERLGRLPDGVESAEAGIAAGGYIPYVDLTEPAHAMQRDAARALLSAQYEADSVEAARAAMLAEEAVSGLADVAVLNTLIETNRAMLPPALASTPVIDPAGLPTGISYYLLGKRSLAGSVGSRYMVVARHYDLWREGYDLIDPSIDPLGADQSAFVAASIAENDDATWTVLGSSVALAPLVLDVSTFGGSLPTGFPNERFYLSVDQWDGFPVQKQRLLEDVLRPRDALVISGDIHSALMTDHGVGADGGRAIELTCPGISSGNFRELLYGSAQQLPSLRDSPVVESVLNALDYLLQLSRPNLVHSRTDVNGLVIAELDATGLRADFWQLPAEGVLERFYERASALEPMWIHAAYRVDRTSAGHNTEIAPA
jgi:alkaline phosphatase D